MIALLVALALAGCGEAAALDRLASTGQARVVEARSGDVVVLEDGERVKLAGLATLRPRDPHGSEARAALEALVVGREVELLSGGAAKDPFGRRVAHLRLVKGRRWVQGEMLKAGAGRVRTFADNRAMAAEMLEAEAGARIAGRGLWASGAYPVLLPGEARGAHGFQIVEGRVTAVRPYGRGAVLDVQGLRIDIPGRASADFAAAGKAPAALNGRLVRLRGTVRRGASMWIDHPEAVEVLDG